MRPCFKKIFLLAMASTLASSAFCFAQSEHQNEADLVRQTELTLMKALVDKNVEAAQQIFADDYQFISPGGNVQTKEQFFEGLASDVFYFKKWEPGNIEVRMYGDAAAIRYQAQLHIVVMNQDMGEEPRWFTNIYEKSDGRWQIVWSQASIIQSSMEE